MLALGAPPTRAAVTNLPSSRAVGDAAPPAEAQEPNLAIGNTTWTGSTAPGAIRMSSGPSSGARVQSQGTLAQPSQLMLADDRPPWPTSSATPDLRVPVDQGGRAPAIAAAATKFVPTYEWAAVPEGASVPPGLEIQLAMDGSGRKMARISATWRMLVVAEPSNDSCRFDVSRHMQLGEVRTAISGTLIGGNVSRVTALLADGVMVAMEGAAHGCWMRTVEQAQLFGRRITCIIAPEEAATDGELADAGDLRELDQFLTQLEQIEGDVAEVERALDASRITVSRAHSELAQLEARLDRLQCKGIDAAPASSDAARQQRRELTRRSELLSTRLHGLFVGLGASKRQGDKPAPPPASSSPSSSSWWR